MTAHVRVVTHRFDFDQWVAVLDALEDTATVKQREDAQDILQRNAPYDWLAAAEAREVQR